jgi:hypothetical protein
MNNLSIQDVKEAIVKTICKKNKYFECDENACWDYNTESIRFNNCTRGFKEILEELEHISLINSINNKE